MLGSRNAQDALAFRLGQPVCRPPCVRFVFADHVLGLLVCRQRAIPTGTLGVPPLFISFCAAYYYIGREVSLGPIVSDLFRCLALILGRFHRDMVVLSWCLGGRCPGSYR